MQGRRLHSEAGGDATHRVLFEELSDRGGASVEEIVGQQKYRRPQLLGGTCGLLGASHAVESPLSLLRPRHELNGGLEPICLAGHYFDLMIAEAGAATTAVIPGARRPTATPPRPSMHGAARRYHGRRKLSWSSLSPQAAVHEHVPAFGPYPLPRAQQPLAFIAACLSCAPRPLIPRLGVEL